MWNINTIEKHIMLVFLSILSLQGQMSSGPQGPIFY